MNRLVLIGNGFDLAHGLKTSYHDFILDYLKDSIRQAYYNKYESLHINNEIFDYKDILIRIKVTSSLNISYGSPVLSETLEPIFNLFSATTSVNELLSKIESNVDIDYNDNIFVKSLLNECVTKNWVDIESLYYEELKMCLKQYKRSKEYGDNLTLITGGVKHLNNQLEFLKNRLEEYLSNENKKKNDKIKSLEDIFFDLRETTSIFVNFNYTNTLKEYVTSFYSNFQILNIHGELNNANNPIIFGYGDEVDRYYKEIENLNENEFFKHIKSFDYFKTSNYNNLLNFLDADEFEVFTMGHSCGLSDRTMLSTIFEHKFCKSIKIFYYKDYNDYRNKTYEISRHFNDKAAMRDKIVPFPECVPMPQYNDKN